MIRITLKDHEDKSQKKEYIIVYDLNACIDIKQEFGSMKKAIESMNEKDEDGEPNYEAIIKFLKIGINHGSKLQLTDEQIGAMIEFNEVYEVSASLVSALN